MRRILLEQTRKARRLLGADLQRVKLVDAEIEPIDPTEDIEALNAALYKMKLVDATAVELVQLRYFTGLQLKDVPQMMNISTRLANRLGKSQLSRCDVPPERLPIFL